MVAMPHRRSRCRSLSVVPPAEHWRLWLAAPGLVSDGMHDRVGGATARQFCAPASLNELTDGERALRDLAFPPIEPPFDSQRCNAIARNGTSIVICVVHCGSTIRQPIAT
jgi:hypothetical protein